MAALDIKKVLAHLVEDGGTIVVTIHNISALPITIEDSKFKSEHVSVNEIFSNPSAQTVDWKVITNNGSLIIDVDKTDPSTTDRSNAISGTTDLTLYLNPTDAKGKSQTVVVTVPSFSSLPKTVSNSSISANHVCVKSVLSDPLAQTADWKVNTSNGSFTISSDSSSAISGSTTATLYFTVQTS